MTMEYFLQEVSERHQNAYIMMVMDNASCHHASTLKIPANIEICSLPAYSPDFNPQENIWDEMREKYFGNEVFRDMDAVEAQMIVAMLAIENNTHLVKSITGREWILKELV
jgi:transposase